MRACLATRAGQKKQTRVVRLIVEHSADERVVEMAELRASARPVVAAASTAAPAAKEPQAYAGRLQESEMMMRVYASDLEEFRASCQVKADPVGPAQNGWTGWSVPEGL